MARSWGPQASFLNRLWWSSDNERQCSLLTPEGWDWPGPLPPPPVTPASQSEFPGKEKSSGRRGTQGRGRAFAWGLRPLRGLKGSALPGDLPGREPGAGTEPRRVQPCLGSLLFAQAYHHHLTPAAHKQSTREQLTQGWTCEAMHSSLGWQHSSVGTEGAADGRWQSLD